jgi:beta-glucosidase
MSIAGLAFLSAGMGGFAYAKEPHRLDKSDAVDQCVEKILAGMTLDEKIAELSGKDFMDGKTNDRLGIPPWLMTDGPNGTKDTFGPATCFPTLVTLGAAWDEGLARRYGAALGEETRGQGRNVLLGPCINLHRTPLGGRNFESMGEDPWLVARLAVSYIQGLQNENIVACVKHFAANNQEWARMTVSAEISERALQELYLPAFRAAVMEAGVGAVMGAYNRLNGDYCCQNRGLLTDILRNDWGFRGLVISDWGAIHNSAEAINSGCDLEMPGPAVFFSPEKLRGLMQSGLVSDKTIDQAVRRILRVKVAFGFFKGKDRKTAGLVNTPQHQALAREIAEAGIVLLKNQGATLPLDPAKIKSIAVIGPNAAIARLGGGGSSTVTPPYAISPLAGIRRQCGSGIAVTWAQGCLGWGDFDPVPAEVLTTPGGKPGLQADYFANLNFDGEPQAAGVDSQINFDWGIYAPQANFPADNFSVRWTGKLKVPKTGVYKFYLVSDDGSRMFLDDRLVVDNWGDHGRRMKAGAVTLQQGEVHRIKIEYYERTGQAFIQWGWNANQDQMLTEATAAAARSEVAVVVVGLNNQNEGEGVDRLDMLMPQGQDELIQAVAAANPRTIVVLVNGTPLAMRAWVDKVPAIVEAWYPGMEGGNAIANILFGEVNPSGKLPVTFPEKLEDNPTFGNYPGTEQQVHYQEGIFMGYRYYDQQKIAPLFPFGHGLSYTTFAYSGLEVTPAESKDGRFSVKLKIKNTGAVAGQEVVQLYIHDEVSSLPRPPQELKGFKKVALKPGETQAVTFALGREALSFYNPEKQAWQAEPGKFMVFVGSSSRDIRAQGEFILP